jgi:conjugative transfer region protein (TIGR03750 family)
VNMPSSKYLTHKHPMWYGCTLQEMSILSILGLISISIIFVVIPSLLGLPTWIGIIIGGIAIKPVVKRLIMWVGDWKKDRPHGYLMTVLFIRFAEYGLMRLPYVRRIGPWRTYRRYRRIPC